MREAPAMETDKLTTAKKSIIDPETRAAREKHRQALKQLRLQYYEETRDVPTKAQLYVQRKEVSRERRESDWQAYLGALRPQLEQMPYGIRSIRRSLQVLQRKPTPRRKTDEGRPRRVANLLGFCAEHVVRRRTLAHIYATDIASKVITSANADECIRQALSAEQPRDDQIGGIVRRHLEHRSRLAVVGNRIRQHLAKELGVLKAESDLGLERGLQTSLAKSVILKPSAS
jgi:hypothetical protein